jgi:hypothetical protein
MRSPFSNAEAPEYTPAFALERYNKPEYLTLFENLGTSGQ